MPELPEVQTIVDDLNKKIKGDIIVDFESEWKKAIKSGSFNDFKKGIIGRNIVGARRIGKNIFIDLSGGKTIYIHLKMTGHLLVKSNVKNQISKKEKSHFDEKVNQYIRHKFHLKDKDDNKKTLEFSDLRKFGKIALKDTTDIKRMPGIIDLGIDVMHNGFTLEKFKEILEKKKKSVIGNVVMDQSLMAGIGNIYRSEILFKSGVSPDRRVGELNSDEIELIYENIVNVMKEAIKYRGTSDSDYRDTSGAPGEMHKHLMVYNREGEKCLKCGTIIEREKLGQRSVFICPKCQK